MLVIGHRGAAGLARENSIEALRAGHEAGADILEFDVRLTKDGVPVVIHDFHMFRTHRALSLISRRTFDELRNRTGGQPIVPLADILDEFFGHVILNIELKSRGSGAAVTALVKEKFITKRSDWDNILFSSFRGSELAGARKISKSANLALLHAENAFLFIAYHRWLRLTAVGFHRLYVNRLALEIAKRAKLFTYAYTVNRPQTALKLARQGLDGVVTDRPDLVLGELDKQKDRA